VNRAEFIAAAAAALAGAHPPGVTAEITLKRDSDALLAPFTVAIALRNTTRTLVGLDFPTSDLYRIDVERDAAVVWSSAAGHKPLQIARRVDVPPGLFRLISEIVDGTTLDHRAYAPGTYTVRVAMLGTTLATATDTTIAFAPPVTIAEALAAKTGVVVTTAGVPSVEAGVPVLRDATGTLRLARVLGPHPTGTYVVRGYLDAQGDLMQFAVGRFAPAFDNLHEARPPLPPR
jgi:hypothetical protein